MPLPTPTGCATSPKCHLAPLGCLHGRAEIVLEAPLGAQAFGGGRVGVARGYSRWPQADNFTHPGTAYLTTGIFWSTRAMTKAMAKTSVAISGTLHSAKPMNVVTFSR